jgi:hypothetical protein
MRLRRSHPICQSRANYTGFFQAASGFMQAAAGHPHAPRPAAAHLSGGGLLPTIIIQKSSCSISVPKVRICPLRAEIRQLWLHRVVTTPTWYVFAFVVIAGIPFRIIARRIQRKVSCHSRVCMERHWNGHFLTLWRLCPPVCPFL